MKTTIILTESDIKKLIKEKFNKDNKRVKSVEFEVIETGDCFDRKTGHLVTIEVEIEEK